MPKRVRFERPPLIFALGQVVMSDVLKMGDCVPDIQEELRKHGFPLFQEQKVNSVLIGPGSQPTLQTQTQVIWIFRSGDQRTAVTLTQQSFVLQTSQYRGFGPFLGSIEKVADAVHRATDVALCTRLGLRYVNRVGSEADAAATLDPSVLGLRSDLVGPNMTAVTKQLEQVDRTPVGGTLVMRVSETRDGAFLPGGLGPGPVPVMFDIDKPPQPGTSSVLLDLDHFSTSQFPFDARAVTDGFEELHAIVEARFLSVLTEKAHEVWGASESA